MRVGINVLQHKGNEFAQTLVFSGTTSARACICNVYIPPTGNLGHRSLTEDCVRQKVESMLSLVLPDAPVVLCGDFNTRTGCLIPSLT